MNKIKPMLPIFLCLGVLVVLFIVGSIVQFVVSSDEPTDPPSTEGTDGTELPISPEELYGQAQTLVNNAANLVLDYTYTQDRTVAGETFNEERQGTASYIRPGKANMQALISESLTYGGYSTKYYESYISGRGYCRVNNYSYACEMKAAEFMNLQLPAAALDETLYGSITHEVTENGTVITFSDPSDLESWVTASDHTVLSTAWGTAVLNSDNQLVSITYHAEYSDTAASYTLDVSFGISTPSSLDLSASQPVYPADCALLSDLQIPRYLMRVVGDLYSTESVSAQYTDNLYSGIHHTIRSQSSRFDFCGSGSDFMAALDTEVTVTEYSGTSTTNSQSASFLDGIYSYSYNGADPIIDDSLSAEQARQNWEDNILSALLTFDAIAGAELTDTGDFLYINFIGTDAYADSLSSACCTRLGLMDLNTYADSFTTEAIGGYLTINKHTGMPTAMGINFKRTHVIGGVPYALTYQIDQSITLPGIDAHYNITGEQPEQADPSEGATPLFYQITTADGKIMWLLGTVSVGDGRTANLPSAITDAFASADALAVEYDPAAFEQALATDSALLDQLTAAYYYSNNSTTADHLPEDLYAKVYPLLLATGSNSVNAPYMRAIIWENLIESLFLQQSHSLTTGQSMDQQLLNWAGAQEKPIYEIESFITVMNILAGYSDELQTALLEELLRDGLITYAADINRLYENWCAGDEAALLEDMITDTSAFTEEQLALYNEHYQETRTNRLKTMLSAAKGYLAGEETVFYAVNIEYLLGEDGLVAQLIAAGYTVEPVSYE